MPAIRLSVSLDGRAATKSFLRAAALSLFSLLLSISLAAQQQQQVDLTQTSIEDLLNVRISSVSKSDQKLSETPAAVFVISQSDIAHSGATNIPDLLRMVPGMDVAQIGANTWAISARGLNALFSNELLVMVDGRTVYTPTFGGVFWDAIDMPFEDIERIEVIRGSAGSVWGANAVNGIVNIITKSADETRGGMAVAGAGNTDQAFGTVQFGGDLGKSTVYRAYAKYFDQSHLDDAQGIGTADGWHMYRIGMRIDTTRSSKDSFSFRGDMYEGREGIASTALPSITSAEPADIDIDFETSGGFLQGVWKHVSSPRSNFTLGVSYDQYDRGDALDETRKTLDVDFQQNISWGERQKITWGLDARDSLSRTVGTLSVSLNPAGLNTEYVSGFLEDEISIVPHRIILTLGSKLDHDFYSGFQAMPTIRIAWMPGAHHTIWAGASRALRTPAATDTAVRINFGAFPGPGGTTDVSALIGNPNIQSEAEISFDAGYRAALSSRLSLDFALYVNDYDDQETIEPAASFLENNPAPPHTVIPVTYQNLMNGDAEGFEVFGTWNVSSRWTISPGYAFERIRMYLAPGSQDTQSVAQAEGSSPANSAQVRSNYELPHHLNWNLSAFFTGRLLDPAVPAYTRLDTGLSWKCSENFSIGAFGQNLLQAQHEEFVDLSGAVRSTLIKRGGYAKLTWSF